MASWPSRTPLHPGDGCQSLSGGCTQLGGRHLKCGSRKPHLRRGTQLRGSTQLSAHGRPRRQIPLCPTRRNFCPSRAENAQGSAGGGDSFAARELNISRWYVERSEKSNRTIAAEVGSTTRRSRRPDGQVGNIPHLRRRSASTATAEYSAVERTVGCAGQLQQMLQLKRRSASMGNRASTNSGILPS